MILIIVPCFNEKSRLKIDEFKKYSNSNVQFIFADDGSTDGTAEFIQAQIIGNLFLHLYRAPHNMGKGPVIQNCYLHIKMQAYFDQVEWLGFWDADLATPLFEIENMIKFAGFYGEQFESVWGSRVYKLGSKIVRSSKRHYFGRLFATVAYIMLKIESYDSQCGAKIFKKSILEKAFGEAFISRWLFDVEILLRLRNKQIVEYPLKQWVDVEGSKMRMFREAFKILRDLIVIREKYFIKNKY